MQHSIKFRYLHGENFVEVKDCLLPVGVLGLGASGKRHGLVAGAELDVEVADQSCGQVTGEHSVVQPKRTVDVVVAKHFDLKWHLEVQFLNRHCVDIDLLHKG